MQKRIITLLMVITGAGLGISLFPMAQEVTKQGNNSWLSNNFTNGLVGAIIFSILSLGLAKYIVSAVKKIEATLNEMSLTYLLFESTGATIGLTIGVTISIPVYNLQIPVINSLLPILVMIILGYSSFRMETTRVEEWKKVFTPRQERANMEDTEEQILERKMEDNFHKCKVLDANVIIDGRIYGIARTGFLEDVLLVPDFVLCELRYIADSGDSLKRVRGRRDLNILNALREEEGTSVEMYDGDFENISEVDSKLVELAKLLDGVVMTSDYSLNKVSEFQNIPVLNINALANAVKPVVIPGKTMNVMIVKAGTERQQGVVYLDDDMMVVVEDGQHYMNEQIEVVAISTSQTTAERMILAKPAHAGHGISDRKGDHPKDDKN